MFRKLKKNKKAQNTAEYAILISLVVAGIIAMQTYAQRALQARVRDASLYMRDVVNQLGNSAQYEPYYLDTDYTINRDTSETRLLTNDATAGVRLDIVSNRTRGIGGSQVFTYNNATITSGQ